LSPTSERGPTPRTVPAIRPAVAWQSSVGTAQPPKVYDVLAPTPPACGWILPTHPRISAVIAPYAYAPQEYQAP
jgi:hypothetical protein